MARKLTEPYSLMITPEMRRRIDEKKSFHGLNMPDRIRRKIEQDLTEHDMELLMETEKIVEVIVLPGKTK